MADRFWVGGGSSTSWQATGNTNWGTASGVQDNASVPTSNDDVYFDANSPTTTPTSSGTMLCSTLTTNGWGGYISFGANYLRVSGDISFAGMTGTFICYIQPVGNINFDAQGKSVGRLNTQLGGVTMVSNMTITNAVLNYKTFDTNGYNLNASQAQFSMYSNTGILYCRTGTHSFELITATAGITGAIYDFGSSITTLVSTTPIGTNAVNCTFTCGTSTIKTSYTGTVTISLLGKTFYNLEFNGNGTKDITGAGFTANSVLFGDTSGKINILDGGNNWGDLTISAGKTVNFKEGVKQTVTSLTATGVSGTGITLQSASSGNQWEIADLSGTNTVSYCSIKDSIASGGATFDASNGTNTNLGNNIGWLFPSGALFFACD